MSPEIKSITTKEKMIRLSAAAVIGGASILSIPKDNENENADNISASSAHQLLLRDNETAIIVHANFLSQREIVLKPQGFSSFYFYLELTDMKLHPKQGPVEPTAAEIGQEISQGFAKAVEEKEAAEKVAEAKKAELAEQARIAQEAQSAAANTKRAAIPPPVSSDVSAASTSDSLGACGGELPPCWVKDRESRGDYTAVNETGCSGRTCGGAWQFDPLTWNGYGGYAFAQDAPPDVQDAKARELWAGGAGCGHWNACGG
jgi:hypothetical protein